MAHEQIEAEEEDRVREFQGLPTEEEDIVRPDLPTPEDHAAAAANDVPHQQVLGGAGVVGGQKASSPMAGGAAGATAEETARLERAAFAKAQAAKFGKDVKEAGKRGEWCVSI